MARFIDEQKEKRRKQFYAWFNKNAKNVKAHEWLCRKCRDDAYAYNFHARAFGMVLEITKRFFRSDYKRLTMGEAWFLWKHVHPLEDERVKRLRDAGDYYREQRNKRKAESQKEKTVVVEKKSKKVFKKS